MVKVCLECRGTFNSPHRAARYCCPECANTAIARDRESRKRSGPLKTVWSCGGGVQSSAIAGLIIQGKLPKPDYAVMVDVGYEKTSSWENVHNILIPALTRVGVSLQVIRTLDYRDNDLFDPQGHCVLPAYQVRDGKVIRFHTHCSGSWKLKVAMRWMREQGLNRVVGWVGISTDEARRKRPSPAKWYTLDYPLLSLGLSRLDCHRVLWEMGWNNVRHTSCYICPQQSNEQWLYTAARYPDDWARAVALEQSIRGRDASLTLHHSAMPLPDWLLAQQASNYPALLEPCKANAGCADCV